VNSSDKDRYLLSVLPYTRSLPRPDAVSILTPLGAREREISQLQCALELTGIEKNSFSWTKSYCYMYTQFARN